MEEQQTEASALGTSVTAHTGEVTSPADTSFLTEKSLAGVDNP